MVNTSRRLPDTLLTKPVEIYPTAIKVEAIPVGFDAKYDILPRHVFEADTGRHAVLPTIHVERCIDCRRECAGIDPRCRVATHAVEHPTIPGPAKLGHDCCDLVVAHVTGIGGGDHATVYIVEAERSPRSFDPNDPVAGELVLAPELTAAGPGVVVEVETLGPNSAVIERVMRT